MAARADLRVAVVDVDRVPARKGLRDLVIGLIIRVPQGTQRLLRKDHPPAEGGIRWIALRNQHFIGGGGLLGQPGGGETPPPPPDDGGTARPSGETPPARPFLSGRAPGGTKTTARIQQLSMHQ